MKIGRIELRFDKEIRQTLWELIKVWLDDALNFLFGVGAVYLLCRLAMWAHHCVTGSAWLTQIAERESLPSNWGVVGACALGLVILAAGITAAIMALEQVWLFGAWLRGKVFNGVLKFGYRLRRK